MAPQLVPTNMTIEEMIPDLNNPTHDPRFWCLPPVRDQPSEPVGERFPMYLVTQGNSVGVWHNWTVVKAMVSGHPSGAQRGHRTMQGCIAEWQEHCALGVHPHPAEPKPAATGIRPISGPPRNRGHPVEPALQAQLLKFCMPDVAGLSLAGPVAQCDGVHSPAPDSASVSSTSSVTATTWAEVPEFARYFALWGGRVVYSDRADAKRAFLGAEAARKKPRVLSTADYDEAQAFSEGVYWID